MAVPPVSACGRVAADLRTLHDRPMKIHWPVLVALVGGGLTGLAAATDDAPTAVRARDLGVPFAFGATGRGNAITDVAGVAVGHATLIEGTSVRTGLTAILPRGRGEEATRPCFGAVFALNGNGEMTGTAWVRESGLVEGPIVLTNTNSVGVVRDAVIQYAGPPLAAEAGRRLDVLVAAHRGRDLGRHPQRHLRPARAAAHLAAALDTAASGPVAEGNVGGGTGMICYGFKGGIGTASRVVAREHGAYTVGVLVQANHGRRHQLLVAGVPVGEEIREGAAPGDEMGSILIVVATDAPLLPHQLERLARRAALGLARTGAVAGNGSGDLFLAFSIANPHAGDSEGVAALTMLPNDRMDALFEATVGGDGGGDRQRPRGRAHDDRLPRAHGDGAASRAPSRDPAASWAAGDSGALTRAPHQPRASTVRSRARAAGTACTTRIRGATVRAPKTPAITTQARKNTLMENANSGGEARSPQTSPAARKPL
jgi:L-aminopeptidase/D-esterase-like protein